MPPITPTKRSALSLDIKLKILEIVDKKIVPKTEIAKLFNIPKSTLFTIIKNRAAIVNAKKKGVPPNRIRSREAKFPQIETALVAWLRSMCSKNIPVDGNALKAKAQTFAEKLNINVKFKASDGWLQNFKLRNGVAFRRELYVESSSVDAAAVRHWQKETVKKLLQMYNPHNIFNAGETGLFFRMLPNRYFDFQDEACNTEKNVNQRISVLLAANMYGTEKLPLLVIGKFQKPHCFKGVKSLPVEYKVNSKALMKFDIFGEWVQRLDEKMTLQERNILLFISNCTAHQLKIGDHLKSVRIEYFPPSSSSTLQPMDQGVIQSFKENYRKRIINQVLVALETKKPYDINMLAALHTANAAWDAVSMATICNGFSQAGIFQEPSYAGPSTLKSSETGDEEGEVLFRKLAKHIFLPENITFENYVSIDRSVQCIEELADDLITGLQNTFGDYSSDDDVEQKQPHSFTNDATKAI